MSCLGVNRNWPALQGPASGRVNGAIASKALRRAHDRVDIGRIEFEAEAAPARALSGDHCGTDPFPPECAGSDSPRRLWDRVRICRAELYSGAMLGRVCICEDPLVPASVKLAQAGVVLRPYTDICELRVSGAARGEALLDMPPVDTYEMK
jgi:hypothetical protein